MLVFRARLDEAVEAVASVTVRVRHGRPGLGAGRLAPADCRVVVRYVTPGGLLRRHRGAFHARIPPGAGLRAAAWQLDGADLLVTFALTKKPRPQARGAALSDRVTLPFGLEAWGVTAVSGVDVNLRLHLRPRDSELALRGTLDLLLQTPGGALHLRIPFLRLRSAEIPPGLRWRVYGGVTGLQVQVAPGGRLTGEAVLALRYEGRPEPAEALPANPVLVRVHEVTGRVSALAAEPAGEGDSLVRGTVEVDIYGTDAAGRSRWAGRTLPFSALLPISGDQLEPFARVERLSHGRTGVQVTLEAGVTALCTETLELVGQPYRVQRIAGTAAATLQLTEPGTGDLPMPAAGTEYREVFLPLPGPAGGWEEVAVALHAAQNWPDQWNIGAVLNGTPAGEEPSPAPLRAQTGGSTGRGAGEGLALAPTLLSVEAGGLRLRTALLSGPRLQPQGSGEPVTYELPLPGPTQAVSALSLTNDGEVNAIIKTDRPVSITGRIASNAGRPIAATAYPKMHGDSWRLCVIVTREKPLDSSDEA